MLPDSSRSSKTGFELDTVEDHSGIYFPQTDTLFLEVEHKTVESLRSRRNNVREEVFNDFPSVYLHEWLHKSLGYFSPVYDLLRKLDDLSNQLVTRLPEEDEDDLVEYLADIWTAVRVIQRLCESWRGLQECYVSAAQCICIGLISERDNEIEEALSQEIKSCSNDQKAVLECVAQLNTFLSPLELFRVVHMSAVIASRPSTEARASHIQFLGASEKDLLGILEQICSTIQQNSVNESTENVLQQFTDSLPEEIQVPLGSFEFDLLNTGTYFTELFRRGKSVISYREDLFDRFSQVSPLEIWKGQVNTPSYMGSLSVLSFELETLVEKSNLAYTLPPQNIFLESDQELWWEEPKYDRSPISLPPIRTSLKHYLLESLSEGDERITGRQRSGTLEILPEYEKTKRCFHTVTQNGLLLEIRRKRDHRISKIFE
jgi:hypothetical protein